MSYSKYYIYKRQYSDDDGVTWHDVYPAETEPGGEPIGTYDTLAECEESPGPTGGPLTVIALEDDTWFNCSVNIYTEGYINVTHNGAGQNLNNGDSASFKINKNEKVYVSGGLHSLADAHGALMEINCNKKYKIEGEYSSVLGMDKCLGNVFHDNNLVSAKDLIITEVCNCSYLFSNCTSLTEPPSLPATTLAGGCYVYMFDGCTALTTPPQLPATTLSDSCYAGMFFGCTSLTTAPELPATTLAASCYRSMFHKCTSLVEMPILPATTLPLLCYNGMFYGCKNLNSITCLAESGIGGTTTSNFLVNVSPTGTFYKKAGVSWPTGDEGIPSGWTVVEV